MKFKAIFVIFNLIILVSFLFIFLIPFFMLGWDYTQVFWTENWSVALVFVGVMAGLAILAVQFGPQRLLCGELEVVYVARAGGLVCTHRLSRGSGLYA